MWIRKGSSSAQSSSMLPPSCVAHGGCASLWVATLGPAGCLHDPALVAAAAVRQSQLTAS
eukprot:15969657-Heterocapsa_arctica.AAC.1